MAGADAKGTVYFEHSSSCKDRYNRRCVGRWRGEIDFGKDPATGRRRRPKVSGTSRAEVRAKLDKRKAELAKGVKPKPGYNVEQCIDDYLGQALDGRAFFGHRGRPDRSW